MDAERTEHAAELAQRAIERVREGADRLLTAVRGGLDRVLDAATHAVSGTTPREAEAALDALAGERPAHPDPLGAWPSGAQFRDVSRGRLYMAFALSPSSSLRLDTCVLGGTIPGGSAPAALVHSNLFQPSMLPIGHHAVFDAMSARLGFAVEGPVADWLNSASVQFTVQSRIVADAPLIMLLAGPVAIGPAELPERAGFGVELTYDSWRARAALEYLESLRPPVLPTTPVQPPRVPLGWVQLEGTFSRPVV